MAQKAEVAISAILALLVAGGCNARLTVEPGDTQYPQPNLSPHQFVELHVAAPGSLNLRVEALYRAIPGTVQGARADCQRTIGLGAERPIELYVPLQFAHTGEVQTAIVTVDRFEPGPCNWYFAGITYRMLTGGPDDGREVSYEQRRTVTGMVAASGEGIRLSWPAFVAPQREKSYQGRVDLYCAARPLVSNGSGPPQCDNWFHATMPAREGLPPDPTRNDPGSGRADTTTTVIFPDTRVVEVHFHDSDYPDSSSPK